jgi:hypothetical protein
VKEQIDDYLARALAAAPKRGKGARRRRFLRHVAAVAERYGAGLYHTYDNPCIPQTTNDLEGGHGVHKHHIRKATGRRSTSGGPTETVSRCLPSDSEAPIPVAGSVAEPRVRRGSG